MSLEQWLASLYREVFGTDRMDSKPYYLKTAHGTFLAHDSGSNLIQVHVGKEPSNNLVQLVLSGDDRVLQPAALSNFKVVRHAQGISLQNAGYFFCAHPNLGPVVANRVEAKDWETFTLVEDLEPDEDRFRRVVLRLQEQNKPVLIHCGCGPRTHKGFLNLDGIRFMIKDPTITRDEYFIIPFVDKPWNIPDNSVDYIYHEDFIEHISQLQQIQFLAETLRVLKPGCYHRINTPDLIAAMKRHSNFGLGFRGVYTGELQWGHVSIYSRMALKEIAEMVGYREIVFTTKNHGVSQYAVEDHRPAADRNEITGNIYADLLK